MIGLIIKLSMSNDWNNISENVEIAKGKNQYIWTWNQFGKVVKRTFKTKWRKK